MEPTFLLGQFVGLDDGEKWKIVKLKKNINVIDNIRNEWKKYKLDIRETKKNFSKVWQDEEIPESELLSRVKKYNR